jgi:hypothetical protein
MAEDPDVALVRRGYAAFAAGDVQTRSGTPPGPPTNSTPFGPPTHDVPPDNVSLAGHAVSSDQPQPSRPNDPCGTVWVNLTRDGFFSDALTTMLIPVPVRADSTRGVAVGGGSRRAAAGSGRASQLAHRRRRIDSDPTGRP